MDRKKPYQPPEAKSIGFSPLDLISSSGLIPDTPTPPPNTDPSVPDIEW